MTERNAGAIDVQNVEPAVAFAPAPLLEDGENLGREGLVEFDQSDVAPVEPRPGEQPFDRGNRTDPHPRWIAACGRPAHEDRKSVVEGKGVSVRVDLGGRRIIKKKKKRQHTLMQN